MQFLLTTREEANQLLQDHKLKGTVLLARFMAGGSSNDGRLAQERDLREWEAYLKDIIGAVYAASTSQEHQVYQGAPGGSRDRLEVLIRQIGSLVERLPLCKEPARSRVASARAIQLTPSEKVLRICRRFHTVAVQLTRRRENRATLVISDEYDVQDLMHALLRLDFDDVRPEEWGPSVAGSCPRIDFVLKESRIVIECKKARPGLDARGIGSELLQDIGRYSSHPDCGTLVCFVYDPDHLINNPRGLEGDLAKQSRAGLSVVATVCPG